MDATEERISQNHGLRRCLAVKSSSILLFDFTRPSESVETLKRLTRSSDFLAHLGESSFCVMLVECTLEQSAIYLQRVPGTISVSDGRQMFDVPVAARASEYDMEAIYATDVLRDLEEMPALRRRDPPRTNALAA